MQMITQQQIEASGFLDVQTSQCLIEQTLHQKTAGLACHVQEIAMPAGAGSFYSLPAYLTEAGVAGLKWTAHTPVAAYGQAHTHPLIVLNDLNTGVPLAVLESLTISGLRTGAVTATALKYIADPGAQSLLICGSGFQADHQLRAVLPFLPELKELHVWSRHVEHAEKMAERHQALLTGQGIRTIVHQTLPSRLDFANIVIGATSADSHYLHADHFVDGHLYVHIGKRDIDVEAILAFDAIVCDDFAAGVQGSSQSLFVLARSDEQLADHITLLEEIAARQKQVQQTSARKIMFNAFGLSIFDLALAYAIYKHL